MKKELTCQKLCRILQKVYNDPAAPLFVKSTYSRGNVYWSRGFNLSWNRTEGLSKARLYFCQGAPWQGEVDEQKMLGRLAHVLRVEYGVESDLHAPTHEDPYNYLHNFRYVKSD